MSTHSHRRGDAVHTCSLPFFLRCPALCFRKSTYKEHNLPKTNPCYFLTGLESCPRPSHTLYPLLNQAILVQASYWFHSRTNTVSHSGRQANDFIPDNPRLHQWPGDEGNESIHPILIPPIDLTYCHPTSGFESIPISLHINTRTPKLNPYEQALGHLERNHDHFS